MKKRIFLNSIVSGLLLVTSCGKDDETASVNGSTGTEVEQTVAQKTYPITIKAKKQSSISKIALGENYTLTFESTDQLVLKDADGNEYGTLDLQSGAGETTATFSGEIKEDAVGQEIIASIGIELSTVANSTVSLADAVQKYCYLVAEQTFTYSSAEEGSAIFDLTLADQNAYIAFTVADGQKKVSLKKDGDANYSWYDVNTSTHHAWLAVPGGAKYSTRFKSANLMAAKGNIYTVTVTDVIDLGLSVLWCTSNATSSETDQKTWEDAKTLATNIEGYTLPSADNFCELTGEKTVEGVTVSKTEKWDGTGTENGVTFSTDYGSVFFPAAVFNSGYHADYEGLYWSVESDTYGGAYFLYFYGDDAYVDSDNVRFECSVRLVRGL